MSAEDRDARLAAWSAADRRAAVLRADVVAIERTEAVRTLIAELAAEGSPGDDLFDACAILGRLIARHGGSPTLATLTLDHAAEALGLGHAPWAAGARAAVVEGFASELAEATRHESNRAWEFPRCAVPLENGVVAIAAGLIADEDESSEWASRVARAVAREGFRSAIVSGPEHLRRKVTEALSVAGIAARDGAMVPSREAPKGAAR